MNLLHLIRKKWIIVILLALCAMAILLPASSLADGKGATFSGDGWYGAVGDVDISSFEVIPEFKLDVETKWKVIPVGVSLKMNFTIRIGVKGNFDVTFEKANLPESTTLATKIIAQRGDLYQYKLGDTLFDNIPNVGLVGLDMNMTMLGGATQPARVKGSFTNYIQLKVGTDGASADQKADFTFHSIEPEAANKRTVVFIGANVAEKFEAGKVGWKRFSFGPFLTVDMNFMSGGQAEAVLQKDEWGTSGEAYYVPQAGGDPEPDSLHICTENGKDGCVSGQTATIENLGGTVSAHLTALGFTVLNKDWSLGNRYIKRNIRDFVQSLTYGDGLKYKSECDHMLYRVPVQVWADYAHTVALPDVLIGVPGVSSENRSDVVKTGTAARDDAVSEADLQRFFRGYTGSNPYLVTLYPGDVPEENGKGRYNLYLPWKNGKYSIATDNSESAEYRGMEGSALQPSDMKRGANETVHIVLDSDQMVSVSVDKKWHIDFEDKDRPDHVDVLLQKCSYNETMQSEYFRWTGVEKATLNEANGWKYTFSDLPQYEMDSQGKMREIKYRVRELRPEESGDAIADAVYMAEANTIQVAQGILGIDMGAYAKDSLRVVSDKKDLDNINIAGAIRDAVSLDGLWKICQDPSDYLDTFGKKIKEVDPTVVYPVEEYTSVTGETVEKHNTKYRVEYKTEEGTETRQDDKIVKTIRTTISNTAILEMSLYKRWLMFGDAEKPEEVYLALCYRVKEDYRDAIPDPSGMVEKFGGTWIPVLKPLEGKKINILEALGLDILSQFDISSLADVPFAITKVEAPKEDDNPLTAWNAKFVVKKYDYLGIEGIPVEFEAAEFSSVILQDAVKLATGFDLPISTSIIDFFKGKPYITVPGKMYCLPVIDNDWELTGNVINTWYDGSTDNENTTAVGGTKYWANDKEEDRPDTLDITVTGIPAGGAGTSFSKVITLKKADYKGLSDWPWALKSSDADVKAWLAANGLPEDSDLNGGQFIWTVSETVPAGYSGASDGTNLVNTRGDSPKIRIVKKFADMIPTTEAANCAFDLYITDPDGNRTHLKQVTGDAARGAEGTITYTCPDTTLPIAGKDISRFKVTEEPVDTGSEFAWAYQVSGPVITTEGGSPVYIFTVTNRYRKSTAEVTVRKEWQNDDESGRPASLDVALKQDGKVIRTLTLTKASGWETRVADLPAVDTSTGKAISYSVSEVNVPEGYACTGMKVSSGREGSVTKVLITVTNEAAGSGSFVTLEGTKTWDDKDSANRPGKLMISVAQKGGRIVGQPLETNAGKGWKWRFTNLPRYDADGNEIEYQVFENMDSGSAYNVNYHTPVFNEAAKTWTADITNSTETVNIGVRKVWQDENNRYGKRPEQVMVYLLRYTKDSDGNIIDFEAVDVAVLDEACGWDHNFRGLPKTDGKGNTYAYFIDEDPANGYDSALSPEEPITEGGFTLTNTLTEKYVNIRVKKTWEGDDAVQQARPVYVTVRLTRIMDGKEVPVAETGEDGQEHQAILILRAADNWEGVFRGLPASDENGKPITYSVDEDPVSGYSDETVSGDQEHGFVITNKFDNQIIIRVNKVWDDAGLADVKHPESIGYEVTAAGGTARIGTLDGDSAWTDEFKADKFDSQKQIINYQIRETTDLSGDYAVSCTKQESDTGIVFTITNRRLYRDLTITKVWDDHSDLLKNRPADGAVEIDVYADAAKLTGEGFPVRIVTEAGKNEGSVTVRLPIRDENGNVIPYFVEESTKLKGYTASVSGSMTQGYTVTNTLERTDITVKKRWDDDQNAAGMRPESVNIRLEAASGGEKTTIDTVRLNEDNGWTYTFTDKGTWMNGEPCTYTVEEDPVNGYSPTMTEKQQYDFVITNEAGRKEMTITKVWGTGYIGNTYTDGSQKIPDSVTIEILRRVKGEESYTPFQKVTMTEGDLLKGSDGKPILSVHEHYQWQVRCAVQEYNEKGEKYEYTVREPKLPDGGSAQVRRNGPYDFSVVNQIGKRNSNYILVNVVWEDMENRYNLRPTFVTPDIIFMDKAGDDHLSVDESEEWRAVYETERKVAGVAADTVKQYSSRVVQEDEKVYTIYYTLTPPEMTNLIVTKVWNDGGDANHRRPESITVGLYRQASNEKAAQLIRTHKLTEEDQWTYIFEDLLTREAGDSESRYTYSVQELNVPDGYTAEVKAGKESTSQQGNTYRSWTITDTFPLTEVTVTKEWDDSGVAEYTRPEAVEIRLLADGEMWDRYVLTEDEKWTCTFRNLPKLRNDGTEIEYTVAENRIPGYEEPVISGSAKDGFTVKNTADVQDITVTKVWEDNGDKWQARPESVKITLKGDGTEMGSFEAKDGQLKHTFTDLPVCRPDGSEIRYSVEEETVPDGYKVDYSGSAEAGFTVTNRYALTDITVTKVWDDEDENGQVSQYRPAEITVYLLSDAKTEGQMEQVMNGTEPLSLTIRADAGGSWKGAFKDVPVYAKGNRLIEYSLEEDEKGLGQYAEPMIMGTGYDFTVFNWLLNEQTVIIVDKEWVRDDAGDRPESVAFKLLQNGGDFINETISANPVITDDLKSLSKPWRTVIIANRYDNDGEIYDYSVQETPVNGYVTKVVENSDDGEGSWHHFTITNTAKSAPVTITGTKTLTGREKTDEDVFAFGLYDEAGNEIATAESDRNGRFSFPEFRRFTEADAGRTFTYTLKEISEAENGIIPDPTVYTITVTVTADSDGFVTAALSENAEKLTFTNRYEAKGSVTFAGTKTIAGRERNDSDIYSYEITEPDTGKTWTVKNDTAGKILYPEISYVLNDKTNDTGLHTYEVRELATGRDDVMKDETVYTVTVNVTDDGEGRLKAEAGENAAKLDFTNEAGSSVTVTFAGTKRVIGREMDDEDIYIFDVSEVGTENRWTVQNDAQGKILYPEITYFMGVTQDDTGIHTYKIREDDTDEDGVTIDRTVYTVRVEVAPDETGKLQAKVSNNADALDFVNTYGVSTSVTFRGTKTVTGRDWAEDDIYTFEVSEAGTENKWTVQNDSSGKILYPTIYYVKNQEQDDTGIHTYRVREDDTDGDGVTVDTREYTVIVEVTDDGWGNLTAEPSGDAWELDFVNIYGASGSLTFEGTKTVTGRAWKEDDLYVFTIREKGNGSHNQWTVLNDKNGKIQYPTIQYSLADLGVHVYEVQETDADRDGLRTDRTVYTVVVDVEDDEWGHLVITPTENAKALNFVNRYGSTGSITFQGTKYIAGREMDSDDVFKFEILEKDTLERWPAENDSTGKIRFPEIDYVVDGETDDTGIHTYYVREINSDVEQIGTDNRLYEVTVEVTDNGDGTLAVKASDNAKALNFENQFGATGSFYFSGVKTIEGRDIREDDIFLYEIAETGTDNKWYFTNNGEGRIVYPRIGFVKNARVDETGKHTYTVREVKTDRNDMVFDETVYTTTVEVSEGKDQTLVIKTGDEVKQANFSNVPIYTITYDPNGGTIDGQTTPVTEKHMYGTVITIRKAPVRSGYDFLYWQGSAYQPGDKYTVTGDHTFTAQWEEHESPQPSPDYRFTFTKKWSGGHEDSIDWTLYKEDGTTAHKKFNKKIVSDSLWEYEAWFESDQDYYIIENVPKGYQVRYENVGAYAGVTDRCYNGGTIINSRTPKTGDNTHTLLWVVCTVLGLAGITAFVIIRKRRSGK
ncbi:MAG: Cna B-type domain-containing protein [Clostridia bacterium]|nr:Cna B-type domain-containing protein [Clostridia bacterium]